MTSHHQPHLVIDNTHRVPLDYDRSPEPDYVWNSRLDGRARHIVIRAMPSARAGQATPRAVLRRLGHAVPIAIAIFALIYFGLQLVRGVL